MILSECSTVRTHRTEPLLQDLVLTLHVFLHVAPAVLTLTTQRTVHAGEARDDVGESVHEHLSLGL